MDQIYKKLKEALKDGQDILELADSLAKSMSKEERLLQLKLIEMNNFIKKVLEINEVSTNNPVSFKASVKTLQEFVKYIYNEDLLIECNESYNGNGTKVITYTANVCDTDIFEISFKQIEEQPTEKDEIKEFLKDLLASLD